MVQFVKRMSILKCEGANVIFLGIDALRYDHLGFAGYHRNTSPNIDKLAKESIVFQNCFSQAPITAPSFSSIFTSRYPTFHGVTDIIRGFRIGRRLAPLLPTLTSILKEEGYVTGAFTEGVNLGRKIGLGKGFDTYETTPFSLKSVKSHPAFKWIRKNSRKKFFLFFHTYATHAPYLSPAPYNNLYYKNYRGSLPTSLIGLKRITRKFGAVEYYNLMWSIRHKPAELEFMQAQYDGCINYLDNFIGQFVDGLRTLKLLENTIIILTSDHGEEFMDHGRLQHNNYYDELLHVPLLIKLAGVPKKIEVDQIVRSIDIAPTVLDILRLSPEPSFQGLSLLPTLKKDLNLVAPMEFAHYGIALRTAQFKYIFRFGNKSKRLELYNIVHDPMEKENLAAISPQLIEQLHRMFEEELTKKNLPRPLRLIFLLDRGVSVSGTKARLFKEKVISNKTNGAFD